MPKPVHHAPEVILRARQQYLEDVAVERILADANTNSGTLYKWLSGEVPDMTLDPIPRRRPGVHRERPLHQIRAALVSRLWRGADQQMRRIEQRLAEIGVTQDEGSREQREFAVMVKTVRDLVAMGEREKRSADKRIAKSHDEPPPVDLDDFRRRLAAKIAALNADTAAETAGEP